MDALWVMTCEVEDGQPMLPGHVIAPGDQQRLVTRSRALSHWWHVSAPPVNRHRTRIAMPFPFDAENISHNYVVVIVTDLGDAGTLGHMAFKVTGVPTIAQDEASSVVWGMPGEAVKRGGAQTQLPMDRITGKVISLVKLQDRFLHRSASCR